VEALRGQDIVIAAGLFALREATAAQSELSRALGIPRSRVSESVRRLADNGLYSRALGGLRFARFLDYLVNGLPWMFPARPGEVVRGIPTSHAGPVLNELIASSRPFVWPSEDGDALGRAVEPVHRHALNVARVLPEAYQLLSLADGIRVGRVREKRMAAEALEAMFHR
jgi:DNA-binding Lrp family transcriptional regulator